VFSDIGNAFTAEQGMDLGDLRYSVGAGIRWKSPFGPIRIDLAKALNAKKQ
jgi:outer membrane protein insertion porin family